MSGGLPPAVMVAGLGAARAARAAGRCLLLSVPGAAGSLGPGGWRALMAAAGPGPDALCADDAPGHALAALAAGCAIVVLAGQVPAFDAVAAVARARGATLLPARPPALDLTRIAWQRRGGAALLARWLTPDDSRPGLG